MRKWRMLRVPKMAIVLGAVVLYCSSRSRSPREPRGLVGRHRVRAAGDVDTLGKLAGNVY